LEKHKINKLTYSLFIIYLITLIWIIVFKLNVPFTHIGNLRTINLIPFSEPLKLNGKISYNEMIMNVVVFVPLGIYTGILFEKWKIINKLFLFFLISFTCELLQYIFSIGASDITDLINNTLGGLIGLIIYKVIERAFKNKLKAQKFINLIAKVGTTIIILLLLLFLRINNRLIFRI